MNVKKTLKDNGYSFDKKSQNEIVIAPNIKLYRGLGYIALILGIFRCFTGNILFAIIPILTGLYFVMQPESKEYKAININKSIHIIANGIEIRSKSGRKFYSTQEFGDLQVNQISFLNIKAVTLSTKLLSTGKELILMRAIDSEMKQTEKLFEVIANRMIDNWI